MSNIVLVLALGPVQEFIVRARRMRDLWFGSRILSELSRAAARSLHDQGWELVFPSVGDRRDLDRCEETYRKDGRPLLEVSNKLVAVHRGCNDDLVPANAAKAARATVVAEWRHLARRASAHAERYGLLRPNVPPYATPDAVIEDFLEFYAAWSRFGEESEYRSARRMAEDSIASRKLLRDFGSWQGSNLPKSSLDGFRETILVPNRLKEGSTRYRLTPNEQLDGIGVVKRMGGMPNQFIPITRVAFEPWLQRITQGLERDEAGDSSSFRMLMKACRACFDELDRGAAEWMKDGFPFDAQILLEGQWPRIEYDKPEAEETIGPPIQFGPKYVSPLFKRVSPPFPYVACLVADGDRIGQLLDQHFTTAAAHKECSVLLARFSADARRIVENHSGLLIYSGGDDVLAFLPVEKAVDCANQLRCAFAGLFQDLPEKPHPTMSVGIAIAHVLEPLGKILDLARDAERFAKTGDRLPRSDQRNALCVILDKRSGGTLLVRERWTQEPAKLLQHLADGLGSGRIPSRLPYDLLSLLERFPDAQEPEYAHDIEWGRILRKAVLEVFVRKRPDSAKSIKPDDVRLELPEHGSLREVHQQVSHWVNLARIAQDVAAAQCSGVVATSNGTNEAATTPAALAGEGI